VGELVAECGVAVEHVTIYRWVQMFTPEFIDVARHSRAAGDRAVDQHGQVIDVLLSERRDGVAAGILDPRDEVRIRSGRGQNRPGMV
jgi:transposase-like protein